MSKTLAELKREADEACTFRKHSMGAWIDDKDGSHSWCWCLNEPCKGEVHVHTNPPPNGIDIHGDAVALNCKIIERN